MFSAERNSAMSQRTRFSWLRSIRFRLTAWYALLLVLVMVILGVSLNTLLERELRQDVDQTIKTTATKINSQAELQANVFGQPVVALDPGTLASFPSLLIQAVNANNQIDFSTQNLLDSKGSYKQLPAPAVKAGETDPVFTTAELDGVPIRMIHYPVVLSDGTTFGAINVGEPLLQLNQTLDHLRNLLLIAGLAGVLLAAVGGWFLAGRALRPVDKITETAAAIAAGAGSEHSLSTRLDVPPTGDELARLAATFNRMLDRIQLAFTAQRRFIADASHELRTPLTAIRGNLDVLNRQANAESESPNSDFLDALADLRRESSRMGRLLEDLLILARSDAAPDLDALRLQPCRLDELAGEVLRTAGSLANGQHMELYAPVPVTMLGDPDRLQQLMLVLVDNALLHTPADGKVTLAIQRTERSAIISVSDTGAGIAPEHLPHLFDRFYRVDNARARESGGTGLGLAIAKAITDAHQGEISVSSEIGKGTTFTVKLPIGAPITSPTAQVLSE
jgi:two-component system, OmpR family, sensor kinase